MSVSGRDGDGTYLHLTNAKGRDATVGAATLRPLAGPALGLPGTTLTFRRYLAATEAGTHAALAASHGEDYAHALIAGDPEVDLERVGQVLERTVPVYLDGAGAVLQTDPQFVDIVFQPDGTEKERRPPVETAANINTAKPVRWTGRKLPVAEAVRRFAFRRTVQLQHVDGLTYDHLYAMAAELEKEDAVMLLGTGEKGTGPLIFQSNGRAYRGFLSGATQGRRYRLLLHLSDMELKKPAV